MKKIPTAEEFVLEHNSKGVDLEWNYVTKEAMIEFAKLHVEAALEAANDKVNYAMEEFGGVFPDTVLSVYPLNNIK
jgi:hypothetical protein